MSSSTTSIAELPENITAQVQPIVSSQPTTQQQIPNAMQGNVTMPPVQQQGPQNISENIGQNNYVPMNVHPNPYGNPPQGPDKLPLPEASPQRNNGQVPQGPAQYNANMAAMERQELPSRDIPQNTLQYTHDEQIQPNYVPQPKLTSDYIREYEEASEKAMQKHEETKHREELTQDWFASLQVPILVGILYFLFQMPIVNKLMRKYLGFANIYHEDGNFNFFGLIAKSAVFASLFYSMQWTSHKIASL